MPKSFDELTFSDDWMFQKVMQNPAICAELVSRLLHINVDTRNLKKLLHLITKVKEFV